MFNMLHLYKVVYMQLNLHNFLVFATAKRGEGIIQKEKYLTSFDL